MLVYLDNASTTKPYEEVVQSMNDVLLHNFGNPSSLHKMGLNAEKEVKKARAIIAETLGVEPNEITFTSGGTEADNSVISGIAQSKKKQGNKIITTKVEHPAVLSQCKKLEENGFDVAYIDVDEKCNLNLEQLESELNDRTILMTIMAANNEVGTCMPVAELARNKKDKGFNNVCVHSDAIQAYGKIDLRNINADAMSLSGHKIHGAKGVGAIYTRSGVNWKPLMVGGGQERDLRSGTENVQGIVGFAKAAEMCFGNMEARINQMAKARNYLLNGIKSEIKDIKINGYDEEFQFGETQKFLPSILNVSFLGVRGEVLLHTLEQDNIFVSTRSACSSTSNTGSHVLDAMGCTEKEIEGAIRFGFSQFNTIEEMDFVLDKLKQAIKKMRMLTQFSTGGKK